MKTTSTISMAEFLKEVGKLAESIGKTVYVVTCELSQYTYVKQFEFRCYIEGYAFYTGATPNEALAKLKAAVNPVKPSKIKEILV